MAKRRKSRKGKMPAGLARWHREQKAKKRGRKSSGRKSTPVAHRRKRRGPSKKKRHQSESRNASHEAAEILRAAGDKIRKLSWGFSGRAGRRK